MLQSRNYAVDVRDRRTYVRGGRCRSRVLYNKSRETVKSGRYDISVRTVGEVRRDDLVGGVALIDFVASSLMSAHKKIVEQCESERKEGLETSQRLSTPAPVPMHALRAQSRTLKSLPAHWTSRTTRRQTSTLMQMHTTSPTNAILDLRRLTPCAPDRAGGGDPS